jgi:alanine racemase
MGKIIGRLTSVGIGKESTTRDFCSTQAYWVPVTDLEIDDKVEHVTNDSGLGRIEQKNDAKSNIRNGQRAHTLGRFTTETSWCRTGTALFGAAPSSAQRTTTGVYDHTYSNGQQQQPCLPHCRLQRG